MQILLVEDNFLIAMHLQSILEREGCEVYGPCASAAEALEVLEIEAIEGAVLDFGLADGETSVPVAEELERRGCPYVFVTGLGVAASIPAHLSQASLLTKPIRDNDLRAVLATFATLQR